MQEGLFRARLNGWGYDESTIRTRVSNCRRVEEFEGNLDEHYDRDRCETLLARLTYTMDDLRANRPVAHRIPIDHNCNQYTCTQSLRSSVVKYVQVRDEDRGLNVAQVPCRGNGNRAVLQGVGARHEMAPNRNSYDELFEVFPDIADRLCQFGLENSVYAVNGTRERDELVLRQWHEVVAALVGNVGGKAGAYGYIYIRIKNTNTPEFRFYQSLYSNLFGNNRLVAGGDGNYRAKKAILGVTGWKVSQNPPEDRSRGYLVYFTVAHVFGNRTKNPLLFTAAWNLVLAPNIIAPFTDEENHYEFAERFKQAFKDRVCQADVVRRCIDEYNEFVNNHNVREFILDFTPVGFAPEELRRLREAALRQWEPIP